MSKKIQDVINRNLWERVLDVNLHIHMTNLVDRDGDQIEERQGVLDFYEHVKNMVPYQESVRISVIWDTFTEEEQVKRAIDLCGEYHASRFMMMMDYLNRERL